MRHTQTDGNVGWIREPLMPQQSRGHSAGSTALTTRYLRVLLVCAFLILLVCVGAALTGCSGGSSESSGTTQSSSVSSSAQGDVQLGERVEFGGISFALPEGWVEVEASGGARYYYPSKDDHTSLFYVTCSDLAVPSGQEKQAFEGVLSGVFGDEGKPDDLATKDFKVGDYAAQSATFSLDIQGSPYSVYFVTILLSDRVTMLMAGSPLPDAPYDATFAACIDSIEPASDANSVDSSKQEQSAPSSSSSQPQESKAAADDGKMNAEKFNSIKQGMSYDEVVEIVGSEGELLSTSTIAGIESSTYSWESDGWGIANIMFQNGQVVNKTQVGVGDSSGAKATMDAFNQVENGMSYDQVVEIMGGPGELLSETEIAGMTMSIYTWDGNSLMSSCQITFQDGAVTSKSQYGLE